MDEPDAGISLPDEQEAGTSSQFGNKGLMGKSKSVMGVKHQSMEEYYDYIEEYLRKIDFDNYEQEDVTKESIHSMHSPSALRIGHDYYEDLLDKVGLLSHLQEIYPVKCATHNQANLFNMLKIITGFDINETMYDALTFRENLIISKLERENGETFTLPVGGMCVDVQKAEGDQPKARLLEEYEVKLMRFLDAEGMTDHISDDAECTCKEDDFEKQSCYAYSKMLVHVSTQFDFEGRNAGSSITSWVDKNLHTLEELRKEFVVDGDNYNEKTLYTALKRKWYYIKHTSSMELTDDRKLYSTVKARDYISEGANFILLRYLAMTKYIGIFELASIYINGDLCRNIYECYGPESGVMSGRQIDTYKVKRTIIEECGMTHECMAVLTFDGRLLKQEWKDCEYIIHFNTKTRFRSEKRSCGDDILLANSWQGDIQLFSKYLDAKDEYLMKNRSYMLDHKELKDIMADYINTILMMRPSHIMDFTFKFFSTITPFTLPRNDYFE